MKPVDVKSGTYFDFHFKNNDKRLKSKFGDTVKISKYKNIFAKIQTATWSEEVLVIKNLRMLCHGDVNSDLSGKNFFRTFHEKVVLKKNQAES